MSRWRKVLGMVLLSLCLALPAQAVTYQPGSTITLNSPAPVFGDSLSFTETYPREATGGGRTPQFPGNPNTQVMCYRDSVLVWYGWTTVVDQTNIGDGFRQGITGEVQLHGYGPDGRTGGAFGDVYWTGGPASCVAILYSSYEQHQQFYQIVWATQNFQVGA